MSTRYLKLYKFIIILSILTLILPSLVFAQSQSVKVPDTPGEAKDMIIRAIKSIGENLLGILKKIFNEGVLPVWKKMYYWSQENVWDSHIFPWLKNIWQKISGIFGKELEKRKPVIEEEFQKEKTEMKEDVKTEVPQAGKSLWEKFKELIK